MTFQNKTAIVTGAAQGIGFEICRRLAMEGANVLLNDIEPSLAIQACEKITSENGNCVPLQFQSGGGGGKKGAQGVQGMQGATDGDQGPQGFQGFQAGIAGLGLGVQFFVGIKLLIFGGDALVYCKFCDAV